MSSSLQTIPDRWDPTCPVRVERTTMRHRWDQLTFLHWAYDPADVAPLLPPGLRCQTFGGRAWVGLVPFRMIVRAPSGPALPWISRFPETNVRTYVTAPDGTCGVWFLSLDAARWPAVAVARSSFALPYFWSDMSVTRAGPVLTYTTERRWPDPPARSRVVVRAGERIAPHDTSDLEHFLTARWRLYRFRGGRLGAGWAEHAPWPLHRADLLDLDDGLVTASGLPEPQGEPLVHWSPGVEVRIGRVTALERGGARAPRYVARSCSTT